MRRTLISTLLSLTLGVLLSVAIAWACSCWSPTTSSPSSMWSDDGEFPAPPPKWLPRIPSAWLAHNLHIKDETIVAMIMSTAGYGVTANYILIIDGPSSGTRGPPDHTIALLHAGWPLPCLTATLDSTDPLKPFDRGVAIPPWLHPRINFLQLPSTLPLIPLPAGLAADSLTFGALFALAFPVRRLAISTWRARHRRCITCGYSLVGNTSGTCPECGAPLPSPEPRSGARRKRGA